MEWESQLMEAHAKSFTRLVGEGARVMNIGFGCGYVDGFIQTWCKPRVHTIVEAHPDVIDQARKSGWAEKEGVDLMQGKWQTVLQSLIDAGDKYVSAF